MAFCVAQLTKFLFLLTPVGAVLDSKAPFPGAITPKQKTHYAEPGSQVQNVTHLAY